MLRKGTPLWAAQTGGHQERGRRGGTENVAAIVGFGTAMELATQRLAVDSVAIQTLRDELQQRVLTGVVDARVVGDQERRVGTTLSVCFRGVEGEGLLMALDLAGVCASSGSAWYGRVTRTESRDPAMGIEPEWARGAIRFSLGRGNTMAEIERVVEMLPGWSTG